MNHGRLLEALHLLISKEEETLLQLFRSVGERDRRVAIKMLEAAPKVVIQRTRSGPTLTLVRGTGELGFIKLGASNSQDGGSASFVAASEQSQQFSQFICS